MTVLLRNVDDPGVLAALHAAAFPDGAWSAGSIAASLSVGGRGYVAGVDADAPPVALALARRAGEDGELLTIGVAPSARRRGLAATLLAAVASDFAADGARALILEVASDNHAPRALYNQAGFKRIGARRFYYRRPVGGSVDAIVMRLTLS